MSDKIKDALKANHFSDLMSYQTPQGANRKKQGMLHKADRILRKRAQKVKNAAGKREKENEVSAICRL